MGLGWSLLMAEETQDQFRTKEGGIRLLTTGEIQLAQSVFLSTIDYSKVWIHCDSYLPFGLQDESIAMTPNGEIYFRSLLYRDDYSKSINELQHTFIHEMSHVWQRSRGMNVMGRGLISWMVSYHYELDGRLLSEYSMEQQAQIIADHFILQHHDYYTWTVLAGRGIVTLDGDDSESEIRDLYRRSMREFPW